MAEEQQKPIHRRWFLISCIVIAFVITAAVAWEIWFYQYGVGEYKHSPDGMYSANLYHYYERRPFDGEIEFVRASVVDKATGNTLWQLDYKPTNTSKLYDYGDRSRTFIKWNATSDEVIFPLDQSGKEIAVPMP